MKKNEVERLQKLLRSVPGPTEASRSHPYNITMFKMAYVMFRQTERLNKLTYVLIVLTPVLAVLTLILVAKYFANKRRPPNKEETIDDNNIDMIFSRGPNI